MKQLSCPAGSLSVTHPLTCCSYILLGDDSEAKPFKQGSQVVFIECRAVSVVQLFPSLAGLLKVHVVEDQHDASWYSLQTVRL